MDIKYSVVILTIFFINSCSNTSREILPDRAIKSEVQVIGAMKNVMWKGQLEGSILLDTISDKNRLYGLGPEQFLTGEILVNDGKAYVSRVISDTSMIVEESFDLSAPFFVYSNVSFSDTVQLTQDIATIQDLENYLIPRSKGNNKPFTFKLIGTVAKAKIHIQNLPAGSKVSSPEEAHQGQVNYILEDEEVEIVGYYSESHKGVFTHHDSFVHMHLITKDKSKMGHLDSVKFAHMKLLLP